MYKTTLIVEKINLFQYHLILGYFKAVTSFFDQGFILMEG